MVGTEIGNYRIVEKIGAGGMGVVYKAIDTHLDRVVAIKALSPEFTGNAALIDRFRSEARAQAQLNHPNLATLYAFLVQDDAAYMVMEFVDGETFHAMLARRGPVPAEEAIPIFRQALAGMAHAHRMGIVHRDIKPGNIMLNRDGVVKVMDFGLAKVTGNHGVTRTGVRLGTAYYMSPEQILAKPVDFRSDIYSLGVTLYEMLTGQTPFRADSEYQILNDHVNTPPTPPSGLHPQIPGGIEHAVMKALAKNPDQRFQTADQFAAALEHPAEYYMAATIADATPVPPELRIIETPITHATSAPPVPPPGPQKAFWTPARILVAIGVAALVLLMVGWLMLRRPDHRQLAVEVPPPPAVNPAPVAPSTQPSVQPSTPEAGPGATATPPKPDVVKPAPKGDKIVVPATTVISVRTVDPIDPKGGRIGQEFLAKLDGAVKIDDREAFHAGDDAHLRLEQTASQEHPGKTDSVLELFSVTSGGQSHAVKSAPFVIKGGFLRKKKVSAGTRIDSELSAPVSVSAPPG